MPESSYIQEEHIWYLTDQEHKTYIVQELEKDLESLTQARLNSDCNIPVLSVDEYFDRIFDFYPKLIEIDGTTVNFCKKIAQDAINKALFKFESGGFISDIDRIKEVHKEQIDTVINEIATYRILQQVRSQLDKEKLISYLEEDFYRLVSNVAAGLCKIAIDEIEAELSLCLTDIEREDRLKAEYKNRLDIYKQKAKTSLFVSTGFTEGLLPWQCFTTENLANTCSMFVFLNIEQWPNDIQFELSYINTWTDNKARVETSQLASEWLVIEWLKGKIPPQPAPTTANSMSISEQSAKSVDNNPSSLPTPSEITPIIFIPNQMQTRLYRTLSAYTSEGQQSSLAKLLESGLAENRIWIKLSAASLAYIFKQARETGSNQIQDDMTEIAHWLAAYFSWGKNNPKVVSEATAYKVLRGNMKVQKGNQIRLKQ